MFAAGKQESEYKFVSALWEETCSYGTAETGIQRIMVRYRISKNHERI